MVTSSSLNKYKSRLEDGLTKASVNIPEDHTHIHEGESFVFSEVVDLGTGVTRDIIVITPNNNTWAHL